MSSIVTPHNIILTIDGRQSNAYCISLLWKSTFKLLYVSLKILVHVRTPQEAIGSPCVQLPLREGFVRFSVKYVDEPVHEISNNVV